MSVFLALANRKGGVGKSTITAMLAHALAAWGGYSVLVLDLDMQANASLILLGDYNWVDARRKNRTIADFIADFHPHPVAPDPYVVHGVGDIMNDAGGLARISIVPGSFETEEREREILHALARGATPLAAAEQTIKQRIYNLLKSFDGAYDVILMDCPPGVSFTSEAALQLADKVIVPFRPDYVSIFAVNRISLTIERTTHSQVQAIPYGRRRYVTLANFCQENSKSARIIQEVAIDHPILDVKLPQVAGIANAFDWRGTRRTMARKYGEGLPHARALYEEIAHMIEFIRKNKKEV